jgi:hypothetical protein
MLACITTPFLFTRSVSLLFVTVIQGLREENKSNPVITISVYTTPRL